ncbi:MAG TPA: c-type cytochrome [Woeseiaceae bacterium]|nr:c-type cytochrome [Woeseiaceae bacterium]
MIVKYMALAIGALSFGTLAHAQVLVEGSVEAGQAKSVPCAACHGPDGNSVNPQWPSLAGQSARYIVQQLQAFKNGERSDPLMTPQAMMLSEEDMRNLAVYYAAQEPAPKTVADVSLLEKGQALYRGGDPESGAAACSACHGPTGRGNPAAAYPMLRGQYAPYVAKQLRDYASGQRKSDQPTRMMREIAVRLSEDDIVALASYVQGLK